MKVENEKRIVYRDHLGKFKSSLNHTEKVAMIENQKLIRETDHMIYTGPFVKKTKTMFNEGFWIGILTLAFAIVIGIALSL